MQPRWRQLWHEVKADLSAPHHGVRLDARTSQLFVVATVLLTVFHYYGRTGGYHQLGIAPLVAPHAGSWADLMPFAWWGAMSVLVRVVVPVVLIVWLWRERPADYGLQWRGTLQHAPVYLCLYLLMLPFLVLAATWSSFQRTYPFYEAASAGGVRFWAWEAAYLPQFVGVEFFFRGFLLFGLYRKFGYNALWISAIPYVMIHFNKPLTETLGALVAGIVLGWLALRAKTVLPGIFLHGGIAITMDALAIRARYDLGLLEWLRVLFVGAAPSS